MQLISKLIILICSVLRDEFLVSTDVALRQHLNEYNDHRLIMRKRHTDGNEYISMVVEERVTYIFVSKLS